MRKLITVLILVACTCTSVHAQRFTRTMANLATLVASNPSNVDTNVMVLGFATSNDQGGGPFTWVAGDATATNRGTIFASTYSGAPAGRWKRQYEGPLNVRWFGAKGDNSTDDSTVIQAAIDLASTSTNSNEVYFQPVGTSSYVSGNLIAKSNVRLSGAAYINVPTGATNFLTISNVLNVAVNDLTVYLNSTNHTAFWLANDAHETSFNKVFVTGTAIWSGRAGWLGNGPYAWVIRRSYINEWTSCSAEFVGTEVWFNSDNAHRNTFVGCSFKNANVYNVLATINGVEANSTGHDNSFIGCDIEGPSTFVRLTAAEVNFDMCYFEGPSTATRQIEIDGASIVTIQQSYMWDSYLGFGSTSGAAARLTLRENVWDGIGSSTTSPFIRYTSDSSGVLVLDHNTSKSSVVIYRTGQWWNGTIWQNLTNNEEDIRDFNLIHDPAAGINRRAYSSGPFLDSERFNHPLGVHRYPDNAVGLALKTTGNPTNAANVAMLALENSLVSAGYFFQGIDSSNRFVLRWAPSTNDNIFVFDNDRGQGGVAGDLGVGTFDPNLSPTDFARALTIFAAGTNAIAGLELRGDRTNSVAEFAMLKAWLDTNNVAIIAAHKDTNVDAGGWRFYTKATTSALAKVMELESQGYIQLSLVPTNSILYTDINKRIQQVGIGANLTWTNGTLSAASGTPGSAPTNTLVSLSTPSTSGGLFYASDTIGTNATAAAGATVIGLLDTTALTLRRQAANTFGANLLFEKRGTTGDSNAVVTASDVLGSVNFGGWDSAAYGIGGIIRGLPMEAFDAAGHGTRLQFYTTPINSTTSSSVFEITEDGPVRFFQTSAPTTDATAEWAMDNNLWGASRGAFQYFDGTSNAVVVAYTASDPPATGDMAIFNGSHWTNAPATGSGGVFTTYFTKTITDDAINTIFTISVPAALDAGGCHVTYTLKASDASDISIRTGHFEFNGTKDSGVYDAGGDFGTYYVQRATGSASVISVAEASDGGSDLLNCKMNITTSGWTPTTFTGYFTIVSHGPNTIATVP